jgi:molybdate transport system ATP-binding protein
VNLRLADVRLPLGAVTIEIDAVLKGRVAAVFGPSGAGKTTLLELIAGLRRPTAGLISIAGETLTGPGVFVPPRSRGIGYVPQEGALFPHLPVRGNLLYGRPPHGARRPAGMSFEHVVEVLDIGGLVDRPVGSLSGGEKQRVALGRALLAAPRLLLLDEPLAGLDAALKERLMPYLQRVREEFGVPMVVVTHSAEEVMALCDEVLVLERGKVRRTGAPGELFVPTGAPRYRLREPDAGS